MNEFKLTRICILMKPEPGNANEVEGVLNPAAVRGPDKQLYLFPRLVAKGNYSRIGICKVLFDKAGDPTGVERIGIALEPEAEYELGENGVGGCEDARVTYLDAVGHYAMTYTALSKRGPRIAAAISSDLIHWERVGLANFAPFDGIDFGDIDDKDAVVFPVTVKNPARVPNLAMLHRPLFPGTLPQENVYAHANRDVDIDRESIWISYCTLEPRHDGPRRLHQFKSHHRLATPVEHWERLKIGCGTPPFLTKHGWLIVYHGVGELESSTSDHPKLSYSAGVMVLAEEHPRVIRYRSRNPVLTPELPEELTNAKGGVVFPTGIDRRDDIGKPDRYDVYYGMADDMIGVAKLELPDILPAGAMVDAPEAKI